MTKPEAMSVAVREIVSPAVPATVTVRVPLVTVDVPEGCPLSTVLVMAVPVALVA